MLRHYIRPTVANIRTLSTVASTVKPWYTTTPIFYPNATPHIGHLYTLVTADILARYQRVKNPSRPVKFITGTDEHGMKIQKAAGARAMIPRKFCDNMNVQFRRLAKVADVSHTEFIRTSEERHAIAVQHVWRELASQGLIYKGSYSGWYSITDETFYTESQIMPHETQPNVMVSKETGAIVTFTQEENYMFRLSSFQQRLLDHYKGNKTAIYPDHYRTDIVQQLEHEKLEDISISRPRQRLSWAIKVPGDSQHSVYVWIDALMSYLSAIGYPWANGTERKDVAWPVDIQVIGKDIIRFHAIYLPAILMALKMPLQKRILTHAHWTSSQKKMSKSVGNVADPFLAIEQFGVDSVRYYLAKVGGRFIDDVDWSAEQLSKHDRELQSLLGNFYMRITSPKLQKRVSTEHPDDIALEKSRQKWQELTTATKELPATVSKHIEALNLSEALETIVEILRIANKSLTDVAPWSPKTTSADVSVSYTICIDTLRVVAVCLQPFVPRVSKKLLDALGVGPDQRAWDAPGQVSNVLNLRLFESKKKAKE